MSVTTPRRMLWHPLAATALIGAVAAIGLSLHVAAIAVGTIVCWLAVGGAAGFATSGST